MSGMRHKRKKIKNTQEAKDRSKHNDKGIKSDLKKIIDHKNLTIGKLKKIQLPTAVVLMKHCSYPVLDSVPGNPKMF